MIQVDVYSIHHNDCHRFSLDLYTQSSHLHQHLMHHHLQYQHENPSLSPQQSSTSDADETLTPPPSLNRGVVCFNRNFFLLMIFVFCIECNCSSENS
jgi:hypothetical protein